MGEFAPKGTGGPQDSAAPTEPKRGPDENGTEPEECCPESSRETCERPLGQQPRGRQHAALAYYFQREKVCLGPTAGLSVLLFGRNPYRTQLVLNFNTTGTAALQADIANSKEELDGGHRTISLYSQGGSITQPQFHTGPIILSYPIHGPLVGEEWWAVVPAGGELDATGYNYSD